MRQKGIGYTHKKFQMFRVQDCDKFLYILYRRPKKSVKTKTDKVFKESEFLGFNSALLLDFNL